MAAIDEKSRPTMGETTREARVLRHYLDDGRAAAHRLTVSLSCARVNRRSAIMHQTASMTPNGHAPERNPYTLERTQPKLKARMNNGPLRSKLYITIMNVRAITPYTVTAMAASVADGWPQPLRGTLSVVTRAAGHQRPKGRPRV
jgi:hypothetical protein